MRNLKTCIMVGGLFLTTNLPVNLAPASAETLKEYEHIVSRASNTPALKIERAVKGTGEFLVCNLSAGITLVPVVIVGIAASPVLLVDSGIRAVKWLEKNLKIDSREFESAYFMMLRDIFRAFDHLNLSEDSVCGRLADKNRILDWELAYRANEAKQKLGNDSLEENQSSPDQTSFRARGRADLETANPNKH